MNTGTATAQIYREGDRVRVKPFKHLQPKFHGADGVIVAWCHDHTYRVKLDAFAHESVFTADELKPIPTSSDQQATARPWEVKGLSVIGYPESDIAVARLLDNVGQPARANGQFIVRAVNAYDDLLRALKKSEQRIDQLCGMVNTYSNKLGLGNKVHAEDWSDVARDALAKAESK